MMKKILTISCLLLSLVLLSADLMPIALTAQASDDIITVKLISSVDKLQPGAANRLALEIQIKAPYHINSVELTEEYMIPTSVSLTGPEGVDFGKLEFPEAVLKTLSFSDTPLSVYEGTLRVFSTITLPGSFDGREITVTGAVGYQACDDQACLPPAELEFRQAFPVAAKGELVTVINLPIFASAPLAMKAVEAEGAKQQQTGTERLGSESAAAQKTEEATAIEEGAFSSTVEERGLLLTFILIFLGGLGLNLTPCVYPLIPITIGYFGGQAQGRKGGVFSHAVLYVLGMALTYSTLGVIAALTGSLFGGAMQNPIVLILVAIVMVALALSMFNLYEFRLPSFLTKLAGGGQKGYFGTLLMGLTVGLVAAPCIGPFVLGLLTYVGARGQVLLGFLMFFVLALGLGLPFLFLAVFSGSLDRLPRSGLWMVWVRTIFGFVLLGMAVYFLRPIFPDTLFYHLTLAIILLVGGIYLAWLEPSKIGGKVFPLLRQLIGILFFAGALILTVQGVREYVRESLQKAPSAGGSVLPSGGIQWASYSDDKLEQAAAEARPVLMDFYADWCIPCKELDKQTFAQPEVVEMSRNFVMLKVDLTSSSNFVSARLKNQFQIKGVPTLVLLKPDGSEAVDLRIVGFVKKEKLLAAMEKALASAN
jgi:thiol:disulfide interchange protein DsbD